MRTVGLSVPDVVREIITRNRSIHDCMAMDVINYTALAVKIQPEVEKQIGNPIHLNTIVVAIKRYADAFEKNENVVDEPVLKDARLSMTDRIMGMQWTMKDVNVVVGVDKVIHIDAERGEKKYHVKVPIKHDVDAESPKATYKNGILELTFKLENEKSKGKAIDVL